MAKIIKVDGTITTIRPGDGKLFRLKELQGLVGGYVERVFVANIQPTWLIFNEDGKALGLRRNEVATQAALMDRAIFPDDYIVGDVILLADGESELERD